MFLLHPEFQHFKHTFCSLDPTLIRTLSDRNLTHHAVTLEQTYRQCLRRLDNVTGQRPYNLVVTDRWMFMVSRSKNDINGIELNALGFLGYIQAGREKKSEILRIKPLEIMNALSVPVFKQNSAGKR
jgi:ATP adenylyltransferase/5',5'''-P-1,P-4-tetraphosphate phosphorylase II